MNYTPLSPLFFFCRSPGNACPYSYNEYGPMQVKALGVSDISPNHEFHDELIELCESTKMTVSIA